MNRRRAERHHQYFDITFSIILAVLMIRPSISMADDVPEYRNLNFIYQNYSRVSRQHRAHPQPCGGAYQSQQTALLSPSYPDAYPANAQCTFTFQSPYVCETEFHIQFLDFALESSPNCSKDHLRIGSTEPLCGKVIGIMKYKSIEGMLRIHFQSDDSVQSRGFKLLITRLPCAGNKRSESYPIYERNVTASYEIGEDTTTSVLGLTNVNLTKPTGSLLPPDGDEASREKADQYLPAPQHGWNSDFYPQTPSCVHPNQAPNGWNNPGQNPIGNYPSSNYPGNYPSNNYPGYVPPNSYPGQYPGNYPGNVPPTYNYPSAGQYPSSNFPGNYPSSNYPGQYPSNNYPGQYPSNNYPQQYPSNGDFPQQNPTIYPSANYPSVNYYPPPTLNGYLPPSSNQPEAGVDDPSDQGGTNSIPIKNFPIKPRPTVVTQARQFPSASPPRCCAQNLSGKRFYLTSPGFPTILPSHNPNEISDCLHFIERAHPNICRLRIEFKFFLLGTFSPQLGCIGDSFVEIDGQRVCGCNSGLRYVSQWGVGAKAIRIRQRASQNARGVLMDIVQEDCPYRIQRGAAKSIQRRSDNNEEQPVRLHSAVTHTNSTSLTTFYYYANKPSAEEDVPKSSATKKMPFEQRAEMPVSSKFFFLNGGPRDRCSFGYREYLQLATDPLWKLRPVCSRL